MKIKPALALAAFALIVVLGVFYLRIQNGQRFHLDKRGILMRKIGHEILLHSGDSTSRVLPVTKLPDEKYRLVFEKQFTFEADSLVAIVKRTLSASDETNDYIVNVLDCSQAAVVFGYAVSDKNSVIPCSGRKQPFGCYVITVEFGDAPIEIKKYATAMSLFALVVLCPIFWIGFRKNKAVRNEPIKEHLIAIGNIQFDKQNKQLITLNGSVKLTSKETKILNIFASHPNEVIDRTRLQKEIWEDDGIIVGRSLDVFISKLRRKLESDAAVQLVNIHGKGYKLQIETPQN